MNFVVIDKFVQKIKIKVANSSKATNKGLFYFFFILPKFK